jgi:hypothetical protein
MLLTHPHSVTDLRPLDTEDAPFFYTFKVQCTSCRETHPNMVSVSRFEQNDVSGSKGEANFVWRCKNCKREHSANIKAAPATYPQTDPPKTVNILEFDCRGLEFTDFKAEVGAPRAAPSCASATDMRVGRIPRNGSRDWHQVCGHRPMRRRMVRLRREGRRGGEHHGREMGNPACIDVHTPLHLLPCEYRNSDERDHDRKAERHILRESIYARVQQPVAGVCTCG